MTYLLFASALGLSACAAYYSVMGLVAIFAASVVPIFIMGTLLEASKLVVASWIYRNWKEIPVMMKTYFTIALLILMMLTSMGIFGYLSKAHLDQNIPSGDVAAKLALIDEKIKTEKEVLKEILTWGFGTDLFVIFIFPITLAGIPNTIEFGKTSELTKL